MIENLAMHYLTGQLVVNYRTTNRFRVTKRMEEDHMKNGQLKAGYNFQIATENQFVLYYAVFPNPTDTKTLFLETYPHALKRVVADAGYSSEENLVKLNEQGIKHFIKHGRFDNEQKWSSKQSSNHLNI
ncbi:transposase [Streptococcus gallolyticus]|uniref:Transposase n=1 Tax=Streptococcus gallolyticus TaxID=315405 RepID=A0AA94M102_9STRE|nr:transposase [Streptococcus gallolyticus]AQP41284.1 transposase [Streptococcus gallolyticus subsp. gallolyticus DSM 16831]SQG78565.1 transposase [Streptococcus gallolyticus]